MRWARCRGPATACVLRRQRDVSKVPGFERLGDISVAHLYNLHNSAPYRAQRAVLTKTRPTRRVDIGVRRAPAPEARPGFIRIDSVHRNDQDGIKGLPDLRGISAGSRCELPSLEAGSTDTGGAP